MGKYDDIINLPRHESARHPKMPAIDRAAQFLPFSALSGHNASVAETARLTDGRMELDETRKEELNVRLNIIRGLLAQKPQAGITYFVPDGRKEGGAYSTATGTIARIDEARRQIIMEDGTAIPMDGICEIESTVFDSCGC